MKKKKIGQTNLWVNPLGFGGIPIQRISKDEAVSLIRYTVDKGIDFFDTARGYTDSEEKLGLGLLGQRSEVVLATKSMARSGKGLTEDIEQSLKNLKTDWIDLYQCHNVRTEEELDQLTAPGGGLEALEKACRDGKIRYIGITGHRPEMLLKALKTYSFATVQFPYNYIEQDNRKELLEEIGRQGIGTIIMKPLAGGALKESGAALRFLLSKEFSVLIPGMDTKNQVEENLAQLDNSFSFLDKEKLERERIELGQDFCRRCEYCLPCTAGIHIPSMFLLEGYYLRYNLKDWAKERYQAGVLADSCTECGLCETRCPYQLSIRERLKDIHSLLS